MWCAKGVEGEVYNVGGHNEKTNLEIVKLTIATIRRLMEEEPKYRAVLKKQVKDADGQIDISWINEDLITFVKDRLGHDQRYAIDPTKITDALGWYPETKFEVGIVKTIEWYLNNQDWVEEVTSGDYQKYYEECTERNNRYRIKARLSNKPKNSILREVSPNMLFSFLPLRMAAILCQVSTCRQR